MWQHFFPANAIGYVIENWQGATAALMCCGLLIRVCPRQLAAVLGSSCLGAAVAVDTWGNLSRAQAPAGSYFVSVGADGNFLIGCKTFYPAIFNL